MRAEVRAWTRTVRVAIMQAARGRRVGDEKKDRAGRTWPVRGAWPSEAVREACSTVERTRVPACSVAATGESARPHTPSATPCASPSVPACRAPCAGALQNSDQPRWSLARAPLPPRSMSSLRSPPTRSSMKSRAASREGSNFSTREWSEAMRRPRAPAKPPTTCPIEAIAERTMASPSPLTIPRPTPRTKPATPVPIEEISPSGLPSMSE
mmetsp:Transcript_27717/g.81107  ORF Transcript_27717/g.81107 Transcript_27717/m.81107 type:complete len:211 (+) Transcript_27717:296-928(+)